MFLFPAAPKGPFSKSDRRIAAERSRWRKVKTQWERKHLDSERLDQPTAVCLFVWFAVTSKMRQRRGLFFFLTKRLPFYWCILLNNSLLCSASPLCSILESCTKSYTAEKKVNFLFKTQLFFPSRQQSSCCKLNNNSM